MRNEGTAITSDALRGSANETEQLTSAQLLRRHAQDLIESAERMLAQAEAELETAYAMVSSAGFSRATEGG